MQSIVIIDYGMGNTRSVQKALTYVAPNDNVVITNNADLIMQADRIVFPGQGAIGACIEVLVKHKLINVIKHCVNEKPFLGICLGLQLLFDFSAENGGTNGLSIVEGNIVKFSKNNLKVPHMGWNTVKQTIEHPLWHNIDDNTHFYSVHSYYVEQNNTNVVAGLTSYGVDFTCAIAQNKLFAVQFHPEKSQYDGLQLLSNFVNWQI